MISSDLLFTKVFLSPYTVDWKSTRISLQECTPYYANVVLKGLPFSFWHCQKTYMHHIIVTVSALIISKTKFYSKGFKFKLRRKVYQTHCWGFLCLNFTDYPWYKLPSCFAPNTFSNQYFCDFTNALWHGLDSHPPIIKKLSTIKKKKGS